MLIENDPLDGGGLELEVEFDGQIDDEAFGFEPQEEYDEYDEYDDYPEEAEVDPFFQRDISSQPNPREAQPQQPMPYSDSKLMQDIMYYKTLGYSDEQIMEGMAKLRSQSSGRKEEEQPEFMTVGEEAAWYAQKAVREQLENLINPLQSKVSQYEQMMQRNQAEALKAQNGRAFTSTLSNYGFEPDSLNDADYDRLDAAMENLYPGVDFSITPITPKMAEGIVRLAFGNARPRQQARQFRPDPPKIMGGSVGNRGRNSNTRSFKVDGVPKSERMARLKNFFG